MDISNYEQSLQVLNYNISPIEFDKLLGDIYRKYYHFIFDYYIHKFITSEITALEYQNKIKYHIFNFIENYIFMKAYKYTQKYCSNIVPECTESYYDLLYDKTSIRHRNLPFPSVTTVINYICRKYNNSSTRNLRYDANEWNPSNLIENPELF